MIGRFVGGRLIHKQSNETKNYTPIWKPETVFSSVNNSKPTGFNVVIFTQVFGTPYKLNNFFCRKVFIIQLGNFNYRRNKIYVIMLRILVQFKLDRFINKLCF